MDLEFAARAYSRSLVTYTPGNDSKLVPTGHRHRPDVRQRQDLEVHTRHTAKWQDGQPVKCEDVKYGISRTFATDLITNGPTYILNFLGRALRRRRLVRLQRPLQGDRAGAL